MLSRKSILAFSLMLMPAVPLVAADPVPPPGGFVVTPQLDVLIQWSDGYRSRMDLYYPNAPVPQTGWPGVALVHGGGHSRKATTKMARFLASQGYATFAYDVRLQGSTVALNPAMPGPFAADRLLLDSAECYVVAKGILTTKLDYKRIAMTGKSQGGAHSHRAAAYSGRPLPLAGFVTAFPKLSAIASQIASMNGMENAFAGGTILRNHQAEKIGQDRASQAWNWAYAGRYDLLEASYRMDPVRNHWPLLKTNEVPIHEHMAWDDNRMTVGSSMDFFKQLKIGTPRKALILTNGHGIPGPNDIEEALIMDGTKRWFDRYLKYIQNGIDNEPMFEAAIQPVDPGKYANRTTEWLHRFSPKWPATNRERFYLRGNKTLTKTAPAAIEPGPKLEHRVQVGYDLARFIDLDNYGVNANLVFPRIPLKSFEFVSAPLQRETEFFGRPQAEFTLETSTGEFQVSVALLAKRGNMPERFLVGGTVARRGLKPGKHRLKVPLRDLAVILPQGTEVIVRIENLAFLRPPGQRAIEIVPCFRNGDMTVIIDPATPAIIDLPVDQDRTVGLTPRLADVRYVGGFNHPLHIDAGPARSGTPYVIYASGSGFAPGVLLGNSRVPLNIDPFTGLSLSLINTPIFFNFAGLLDASGRATARMQLTQGLAFILLGQRLTFATILLDPSIPVGGPAQMDITP